MKRETGETTALIDVANDNSPRASLGRLNSLRSICQLTCGTPWVADLVSRQNRPKHLKVSVSPPSRRVAQHLSFPATWPMPKTETPNLTTIALCPCLSQRKPSQLVIWSTESSPASTSSPTGTPSLSGRPSSNPSLGISRTIPSLPSSHASMVPIPPRNRL